MSNLKICLTFITLLIIVFNCRFVHLSPGGLSPPPFRGLSMKRLLFGFLAVLFLILNIIPYLHIMADQSMTDAQIKQVGAFALSSLITTGEATELDFSDYTDSDTDFLLALGELVVTGDPTSLIDCGLDWLGGEIDDAYDSAKQSIREWEYNMSPTLYYWFVDTQPPYELSPTYNNIRDLSQPLRRLLTPPDNGSNITPDPDPNYSQFLDYINGSGFWWKNYNQFNLDQHNGYYVYLDSPNFSYFSQNQITNSSSGDHRLMLEPTTIYINENNGVWVCNINSTVTSQYVEFENNAHSWIYDMGIYYNQNPIIHAYQVSFNSPYTSPFSASFQENTLTMIFNRLVYHYWNCNIFVNGDAWSIPHDDFEYPIIIPDQLTVWNDQPLEYEFPSDTYLKLPDLTNIITNAINNSGVVMWSDIADCFVDVNGQTAVAVTKIVRNDYDNLYMEQYPYPAMLPGMTEQTKFNEHLLDNSHAYLSPMNTVVQETVSVLPSELVGVLTIGAILTIFAVIINRLLE